MIADAPEIREETEEVSPIQPRRWTREEYYRAAEVGIFGPEERLELLAGEVYERLSPQNRPHALSVSVTARALERVFGEGYHVQREQPILLSEETEPEPDLVVLKGLPEDYPEHPTGADSLLVMEISDTTLHFDMRIKSSLYAAAGIPEYWILSLKRRMLYVCRDPHPAPDSPFEYEYRQGISFKEDETVSPLSGPSSEIKVSDLLPRLQKPAAPPEE